MSGPQKSKLQVYFINLRTHARQDDQMSRIIRDRPLFSSLVPRPMSTLPGTAFCPIFSQFWKIHMKFWEIWLTIYNEIYMTMI